jgi:hypothetical protein
MDVIKPVFRDLASVDILKRFFVLCVPCIFS